MKKIGSGSSLELRRVVGGRSNAYLIRAPKLAALVDTSTRAGYPGLRWALRRLGVERLDYLFLTHLHFDHVANAAALRDGYGARIVATRTGAELCPRGRNEPIVGATRFTSTMLALLGGAGALDSSRLSAYPPFEADIIVDGEVDLAELGLPGRILPTPGHSPGSMSLVLDEAAFVGDALFHVFPGSVAPPWAEDRRSLVESWGRLLGTSCRVFLPGHGGAIARDLLERAYRKARLA